MVSDVYMSEYFLNIMPPWELNIQMKNICSIFLDLFFATTNATTLSNPLSPLLVGLKFEMKLDVKVSNRNFNLRSFQFKKFPSKQF
jgi:hypothetical protein